MQFHRRFREAGGQGNRPWAILLVLAMAASLPAVWAAEPARWTPTDPPNKPIGQAKGIFPGRVVWLHEPNVARWDGDPKSGGWYEDRFTDPALAEQMLSRTLRLVTGAKTDAEAWALLFGHYNRTHARGDAGYKPGEKVAVKLNLNCCKRQAEPTQGFFNTPQLTRALLRQMVPPGRNPGRGHHGLRRLAVRQRRDLRSLPRGIPGHPLRGPRRGRRPVQDRA